MNLIAVLLLAFPLGLLVRERRTAYLVLVLVLLFIYPYQTVVVYDDGNMHWSYPLVNAAILTLGLGLVTLGARVRVRRDGRRAGGAVHGVRAQPVPTVDLDAGVRG